MDNGTLRWRRLEDLLDQSSRSLDYDPSQLWLIAGEHGDWGGGVTMA